jgi:hypothetical protein
LYVQAVINACGEKRFSDFIGSNAEKPAQFFARNAKAVCSQLMTLCGYSSPQIKVVTREFDIIAREDVEGVDFVSGVIAERERLKREQKGEYLLHAVRVL